MTSLVSHGYTTPDSPTKAIKAHLHRHATTDFLRGMLISWQECRGPRRDKMVRLIKEVIKERKTNDDDEN